MTLRVSNPKPFTVLEPSPAVRTGIEVRVYDGQAPANLLAVLDRTWAREWIDELNGVGLGRFSISERHDKLIADPTLLAYGNLIRFRLDGIDRFTFVIQTKKTRPAPPDEDHGRTIDISGPGALALTEAAVFYPDGGITGDVDRDFTGATPGTVLATFIDEAQTRGALVGITYDFDATDDSELEPWPTTLDLIEKAGRDGLALINKLTELAIDVSISPTLNLSAYVERGVDRSIQTPDTGPVILRPAHNIHQAEVDGEGAIRNVLLVETPAGWQERERAGSITSHGRREAFLALGSANSFQQITDATTAAFDRVAEPVEGITLTVADIEGHRPYVDFGPGDWILAPDSAGTLTRWRVRALTVSEDADGAPVFVPSLNHVTLEMEERWSRWLKTMSPGTLGGTEAQIASPTASTGDAEAASGAAVAAHEAAFGHPDELADLADVDTAGVITGDALTYDGADWVAAAPVDTLDDLSDVDTSGVSDGEGLLFDAGTGIWLPGDVGGSSGGGLLGVLEESTAQIYTTGSSSFVPVDDVSGGGDRFDLPIEVPASGNILVMLATAANTDNNLEPVQWAVLDAADDSELSAGVFVTNTSANYHAITRFVVVTGLTPGALTIRWGHRLVSGSGEAQLQVGGAFGVATMAAFPA